MGKFQKFADEAVTQKNYVPLAEKKRKRRVIKTQQSEDKLVSIKLYQSVQKQLKEVSFHTGKSQTQLMGELIKQYLPQLEQKLLEKSGNASEGQTSIYDFLADD